MKIIFCGPPHSGKTVLIDWVRKLLPSDGFFIDRLHLDGEGTWSNNPNQKMVQTVRVKRDYSIAFVEEKCRNLKKYNKLPILLVDIGGKLTDDKEIIFRSCDVFVVISNDAYLKEQWLNFGLSYKCRCIGCFDSEQVGEGQIYGYEPYLTGRITGLERGEKPFPSKDVITALADVIIQESGYTYQPNSIENMIDFNRIAIDLQLTETRITMFGKTVHSAIYPVEKLQQVYHYLSDKYSNRSQYILYGARANWISAMAACMFYPHVKSLSVFDMTKVDIVDVHPLPKSDNITYDKINFNVSIDDCCVVIDIHLKDVYYSDTDDYPHCILPAIPMDRPLYVSGRIPHWLLDAILISYDSPVKYVFQPGETKPWICVYANDVSFIGHCLTEAEVPVAKEYFEAMAERKK